MRSEMNNVVINVQQMKHMYKISLMLIMYRFDVKHEK